jgi:opacity protein-like surface antigen
MRLAITGVLLAIWLGAGPAAAEGEEAFEPGFYFGLGAVYAFENFSFTSDNLGMAPGLLPSGLDPAFDDSAGAHALLGYRALEWLGVDFQYEFLEGYDSTRGKPDVEIDSHLFVLNAKLYPIQGRWQPYALAGMGAQLINSEAVDVKTVKKPFETDLGFVGRVGGGLAFNATRHFLIELEGAYQMAEGPLLRHARYGSLGVHFIYRM